MLDEGTKQRLREVLEEEIKALRADKAARDLLDAEMVEHERRISALRKLLGENVQPEVGVGTESSAGHVVAPLDPRPGSVTDEIRRLFEANPLVTSTEVIEHIRSRFPGSRISPMSFSVWNGYFKHGRYRLDRGKYLERYGKAPPY